MDRDRSRYPKRRPRRAWRPARQELDQRSLYPQHVRGLAALHDRWTACDACGVLKNNDEKAKTSTAIAGDPRAPADCAAAAEHAAIGGRTRPASLRAILDPRSAPARRWQIRGLARAVRARCVVLGAERARSAGPARNRFADLRRPPAPGNA